MRRDIRPATVAMYGATAAFVIALIWFLATAPEQVPVHFDAAGNADRWDSKTTFGLVMGGIGAFLVGLFTVLPLVVRKLPAKLVNLPTRRAHAYWTAPERRPQLDDMVVAVTHALGAAVLLVITAGLLESARVASGRSWPSWVFPLQTAGLIALAIGLIGYLLWRTRVPKDWS